MKKVQKAQRAQKVQKTKKGQKAHIKSVCRSGTGGTTRGTQFSLKVLGFISALLLVIATSIGLVVAAASLFTPSGGGELVV